MASGDSLRPSSSRLPLRVAPRSSEGYFSLELVYNPKASPTYASGGPFQYLGITLPTTLATVGYKTNEAVRRMRVGFPIELARVDALCPRASQRIAGRGRKGKA